jgi:hypothetical protein
MCKRMRGLSGEEKAYEISKEIAFWGGSTGVVLILHGLGGYGWPLSIVATAATVVVAYVIVAVFRPGHIPGMVQNHQGVSRTAEPSTARVGVLLTPGARPTDPPAPAGESSGDHPSDPGPLGSPGLRQP